MAVVLAVAIGFVVGKLALMVRERIEEPVINTAISFIVPFIAYLPVERLGASGLVAVVTAGLVTGHGAPWRLSVQDRVAEVQNWKTIELLLEGGVFLLMGLELFGLITDVRDVHGSLGVALGIAFLAALIVVVVRAGFVAPLLFWLSRKSAARSGRMAERMTGRGGTPRKNMTAA